MMQRCSYADTLEREYRRTIGMPIDDDDVDDVLDKVIRETIEKIDRAFTKDTKFPARLKPRKN